MPKKKAVDNNADNNKAPSTEKSEGVSLEQALAEEGKTVDDIGKGNGKTAAPAKEKLPAIEKLTDAKGNEVRGYPRAGTKTRALWDLYDSLVPSGEPRKHFIDAGIAAGYNQATCSTQYAQWRAYHQVKGNWDSVEKFRTEKKAEADKVKQAEKDKVAAKKAAEKAKKDADKKAKADAKAKEKAEKAAEAKAKKEAAAKAKKDKDAAE